MPQAVFESTDARSLASWCDCVGEAVEHDGRAMIFIEHDTIPAKSAHVGERMAALVGAAVRSQRVTELLVEGSATAAGIAERMRWSRFRVETELAPGIVRLRPDGAAQLSFTVKPGSYAWPASVWESGVHLNASSVP